MGNTKIASPSSAVTGAMASCCTEAAAVCPMHLVCRSCGVAVSSASLVAQNGNNPVGFVYGKLMGV